MKHFQFIIGLVVAAAVPVLGSKLAFGYEAVMYYNVYRADLAANGDSGVRIGKDCAHPCNFDDFIKHISEKPNYIGSQGNIADLDDPDVNEAKNLGDWPGSGDRDMNTGFNKGYDGTFDKGKLLGPLATEGVDPKVGLRHPGVIERLSNVLFEAQNSGKDLGNYGDKAKTCVSWTHVLRRQDQAVALLDEVKDLVSKRVASASVQTRDVDLPDGTTYREVDIGATLAEMQVQKPKKQVARDLVRDLVADYNTEKGKSHWAVITKYQEAVSKLGAKC